MEFVNTLDKKYTGEQAVPCVNEGKPFTFPTGQVTTTHGALTVHGSGTALVCGVCGYNTPIGRP